jgi:hypothetical protein
MRVPRITSAHELTIRKKCPAGTSNAPAPRGGTVSSVTLYSSVRAPL